MTEKRIKDLERMGRNHNIASTVCYVLAIVFAITGFITKNDEVKTLAIESWLLGFVFSAMSYQCYNDRRVAILNAVINKLLDALTADKGTPEDEVPEEDTKETAIVSPEAFERFKKGENEQN